MDREEARVKFQDADRLFQTKQYDAALRVLGELEREFPNERHVLYPTARCLAGLKRYPEAREIAERLLRDFKYTPAQELIDRIDRLQAFDQPDVETPKLPSGFDELFNTPAVFDRDTAPKPPPSLEGFENVSLNRRPFAGSPAGPAATGTSDWQPYALWIGLAVASFALLVLVGRTMGEPLATWFEEYAAFLNEERGDFPPVPWSSFMAVGGMNFLCGYILACFPAYWALKVCDGLRYGSFGDDMKDVAVITAIGFVLSIVLFIGWIVFLIVLKRRYELSFGKLIGVVLLFFVFDLLLTIPASILYNVLVSTPGA